MDMFIVEFNVVRGTCEALDGSDDGEGGGVSGMALVQHLCKL